MIVGGAIEATFMSGKSDYDWGKRFLAAIYSPRSEYLNAPGGFLNRTAFNYSYQGGVAPGSNPFGSYDNFQFALYSAKIWDAAGLTSLVSQKHQILDKAEGTDPVADPKHCCCYIADRGPGTAGIGSNYDQSGIPKAFTFFLDQFS